MPQMTIPQALQLAEESQRAGNLPQAEAIYRQILQAQPENPHALNALGLLAGQLGRFDLAVDLLGKVVKMFPAEIVVRCNLGEFHRRWGKLNQAIAIFRDAIRLQPDYAAAHFNLGLALADQGQLDDAIASYRQALQLAPHQPEWWVNLGVVLERSGNSADAAEAYQHALAIRPDLAGAHNNLGNLLSKRGELDRAIVHFEKSVQLEPRSPEAHGNLGNALWERGRPADAQAALCRALALNPTDPETHNNLGNALKDLACLEEAQASFRRAIELRPTFAGAFSNLGNLLRDTGRLDEALQHYHHAMSLDPAQSIYESNQLCTLQYLPACDAATILQNSQLWNDHHAAPHRHQIPPHKNDPSPDRPLKIGYLSADFHLHSVAFFLLPLLEAHDRTQIHVTCYSNTSKSDATTQRLKNAADQWRSIAGLPDDHAAAQILADAIDILVDLSGHTAGNRLGIFARKPAPLQLTYLGYPGTTGLSTIDYRLTDAFADPPGLADETSTEKILRLAPTAWCFSPLVPSPDVSPSPAAQGHPPTFGTFNSFAKINDPLLAFWAQILRQTPNSRLVLKNAAMASESAADRVRHFFASHNIDPARLTLLPWKPSIIDHLREYAPIDIALDTFPYHGTTTTCEALWMGLPVITLAGQRHASRVGVSLLTNAGLRELIAKSESEYVEIAARLANDVNNLAQLRHQLRPQMQSSPLMNAPHLARQVESAYRTIWRQWATENAKSPQ